ncbi:MAG: glycoside hydrolase family 127 protein, partial [Treponema sp.]|nr:glycoside hydrolase family 127 protein [Treponema sp.]
MKDNSGMQSDFVGLRDVRITDEFWGPVQERIRTVVIPYQWEALNDRISGAAPSYCMRNFKLAAQLTHPELDYGVARDAGFGGFVFQDSDLAKWIKAASYTLVWRPDPGLEKNIDSVIDIVCNAQQADGYLNTYYIITGLDKRFTNLKDNHELYCFGHFAEAAAAYYEASGKRKLLDAVTGYFHCIDRLIGPDEGKIHGYPGHEIAEMALLRLYEISGDQKQLRLAQYFIEQRGREPLFFEEEEKARGVKTVTGIERYRRYMYHQAAKPVRQQLMAEGHAVRAVYLYSGMADLARITDDEQLLEVCRTLFADITRRQMYITGGIGQSAHGEAFSDDYDLPNDTAYAETCASIGLAFFARRMASMEACGKYADTIERVLYNGILSGISLDGTSFFYVNPLEIPAEPGCGNPVTRHALNERRKWFGCACCPPNIARLFASLGTYVHSSKGNSVYTHLYIGGSARLNINGKDAGISLNTRYPWDGRTEVVFTAAGSGIDFAY